MMRITDENGFRWYDDGGKLYPGVTSILSVAVAPKMKNYMIANSKAKQEKVLATTADIGTHIHAMIEADLTGRPLPKIPEYLNDQQKYGMEKAFGQWLVVKQMNDIQPILTETMVKSDKYGFAGTFDIYARFNGKPTLIDIKTGFISVQAGWQLAAYRKAAIEMGLIDPQAGMAAIQIKRDGTTGTPFVYEHIDWCEKSWFSCLEVWKALNFTKLNKMKWPWLFTNSVAVI